MTTTPGPTKHAGLGGGGVLGLQAGFGHVAGAFTGAAGEKMGKFLQADGGTIFLDEIGTASPAMQLQLLRVPPELKFEQFGGTNTFAFPVGIVLALNDALICSAPSVHSPHR